MIEKDNNKTLMEETIKKIQEEFKEKQQQLIIDGVIEIYNGKYRTYESYYKDKQRLNDLILQRNKESIYVNPELNNHKYTYYICEHIFDEKTFNYIKTKGEQNNEKND